MWPLSCMYTALELYNEKKKNHLNCMEYIKPDCSALTYNPLIIKLK